MADTYYAGMMRNQQFYCGLISVTSEATLTAPFAVKGVVATLYADASGDVSLVTVATVSGTTFTVKCWKDSHANTTTPAAATGDVSFIAWGRD